MNKIELYPLKFQPIFKETLWGGRKLETKLNKNLPEGKIGESWEISGVKNNISVVSNGILAGKTLDYLIETFGAKLLGHKILERFNGAFPLLIKFIDAAEDLSVQVHPDDSFAEKNALGFGKTEMWYVIDCDNDASLISGFKHATYKADYLEKLESKSLSELLNRVEVSAGDVFFIPPGRVHTIGKGILLAEIQQSSDTTFRIYDWDRTDKNGKTRELHLDDAMNVLDFGACREAKTRYDLFNENAELCKSNYFTVNKIQISKPLYKHYTEFDSFIILMGIAGEITVTTNEISETLSVGETILLPADCKQVTILPTDKAKFLEIYIEF